ncbi:hypothetical protein HID58_050438 [Brassica napus]|uniref:Protein DETOXIFICATION n=2 Tax=Brassica napus TaxID=3708 RepID=A0ABQ8A6B6_BRANA|nr:hypothetical protein HID58_050438 [Brassica napus]
MFKVNHLSVYSYCVLNNEIGCLFKASILAMGERDDEAEGVGMAMIPLLRDQHEVEKDGDIMVETRKLWRIVGPAIFTRIATYLILVITQAFAGHLGELELAAISIISNVIVGFNFGLLLGMASALETLCGQAFGAKKYDMLGVYLQRSWIVLFLWSILLLPMYFFATPILKYFGQPDDIAELSGTVALWVIAISAGVALVVHIFVCWLFVYGLKLGVIGTMATVNVSWWLNVFILFTYATCGGCPLTWTGFSIEAFTGLWEFAKLSASSGIMLCLESWYYKILILMTGNLKDAKIAVDSLMAINGLEMMIPLAFLAATGVRVANELGAGNGRRARFAVIISVTESFIIGLIFSVLVVFLHDQIGWIFSSSETVIKAVTDLSVLLAFTILLNSVQPVLSGVAIGSGWQSFVAYINLGCYYFIGLPLGFVMGWIFKSGVKGIWAGMIFGGTAMQTLILIFIVMRCDWEKEAQKASVRGIWAGMIFGGTAIQTLILIFIVTRCDWDKEMAKRDDETEGIEKSRDQYGEEEQNGDIKRETWMETKKLWRIVGPAIFARISTYSIFVITQAFAGHLGELELAAIAIVQNVIIGFSIGLFLGMASALQTLCGQAFGAKKYDMLGVYMQRSWIVLFLFAILLLPVYLFASPILKFFGQPEDVAKLSGTVAFWTIPTHFVFALYFPLSRFLQCQLKNRGLWLLLTCHGASMSSSYLRTPLVAVVHSLGLVSPLKLSPDYGNSLSSLLLLESCFDSLENWYYKILIMMTGNLKDTKIAVDSFMSINGLEMMIPLAFFAGTGVRVANELGAGNGRGARFAMIISVTESLIIGIVFSMLVVFLHDQIGWIFSSSDTIIKAVNDLSILLAFTILLNSIQPVLSGVAVGSGWQSFVAYINLGCYYFIGLPLGFVMGWIFKYGVKAQKASVHVKKWSVSNSRN